MSYQLHHIVCTEVVDQLRLHFGDVIFFDVFENFERNAEYNIIPLAYSDKGAGASGTSAHRGGGSMHDMYCKRQLEIFTKLFRVRPT